MRNVVLTTALTLGLALLCAAPAVARAPAEHLLLREAQPMAQQARPTQVLSARAGRPRVLFADDFEDGFDPRWTFTGDPTWGITTYLPAHGSQSAYCVGSSVQAPGPYPSTAFSWMMVGPFDLSHYKAGTLAFDLKYGLGEGAQVYGLDSFDDTWWNGVVNNSLVSDWVPDTFSLAEIRNTESGYGVLGRPQVWFAMAFLAQGSTGEGAYVDDFKITVTDSTAPVPSARAASCSRGRTATLKFSVSDPDDQQVSVSIRVKRADGTVVKTLRPKMVSTGSTQSMSFRCGLAKGTYTFVVSAKDAAGNPQAKVASNRLTVK